MGYKGSDIIQRQEDTLLCEAAACQAHNHNYKSTPEQELPMAHTVSDTGTSEKHL